ncbi:Fic family protein [Phragmitibacter flavus]|nr:Fic family protein [Phragmitibacter flavus]
MAALVKEGKLLARGERGGRRYMLPAVTDWPLPHEQLTYRYPKRREHEEISRLRKDEGIPFSKEGSEIRHIVHQPLAKRKPVGYQPAFLDAYQPNVSAYLSKSDRAKLTSLGQSVSGLQPAGTYFRQVLGRLLIDLSWNSSRLEGNTYSLLETERLLELGENAAGKDLRDAQMILNHKAAIELLSEQPEEIGFNHYTVCNLHALLSENLLPDPRAGGRLRMRPVGITGTVYHPTSVPQLIDEQFRQILIKAEAIENPFEQSFFAMVHLPYLQPFEDVNKRVSRLACNIPMVRHNLCPMSFVDVSQSDYVSAILGVYELNRVDYLRDVYLWAYERSCARYSTIRQTLGDPDLLRLRYRTELGDFVREVVRGGLDKATASRLIAVKAQSLIPSPDRPRFIETVETELGNLHPGNIARYRLRPSEFQSWLIGWR